MKKKSEAEMIELLVEEELYHMTDGAIRSFAQERMADWYWNECELDIEELYERRVVEGNDE